MIHSFRERLAWSEDASCEPFWDAVYRKAFPNLSNHMVCTGNTISQHSGIDRVIHLANGKTLYVDEKKRDKDYGDILLEYISVDKTGAPGWMEKDLVIDYLAYAIMPTKQCHLFSWPMLRRAWLHYKHDWIAMYPRVEAKNNGYVTISVAVPLSVVRNATRDATIIDVSNQFNMGQWN